VFVNVLTFFEKKKRKEKRKRKSFNKQGTIRPFIERERERERERGAFAKPF